MNIKCNYLVRFVMSK